MFLLTARDCDLFNLTLAFLQKSQSQRLQRHWIVSQGGHMVAVWWLYGDFRSSHEEKCHGDLVAAAKTTSVLCACLMGTVRWLHDLFDFRAVVIDMLSPYDL